jgi:hypothetical protein
MRLVVACAWLAAATVVAGDTTRMSAPAERAIEQVSEAEFRRHRPASGLSHPADDPDRIDYRKLERIAELAARVRG